ncbi:MAG: rhomboid family intramembrane serine protease [Burkholderiales bacterium]|nr:MAG: rhomboid family intramembrane serine protease [Burkholderiales bacterium]
MDRFWVTQTLIWLNLLAWVANVASGLSALAPSPIELLVWGGNHLPLTREQPWRLLTSAFLHGGIIHLAFNMWALSQVGRLAENFYGRVQFALIYLFSALFGAVSSLFFAAATGVSVGASGAVFGVAGAVLVAVSTKARHLNPFVAGSLRASLLAFVGYSLLMGFIAPMIDNAAHVGGLLAGSGLALIMAERFDVRQFRREGLRRAVTGVSVAMVALFVLWRLVPGTTA